MDPALLQEAADPATDHERLYALATSEIRAVQRLVASNPSADIRSLSEVAEFFPLEVDQNEALPMHELAGPQGSYERSDWEVLLEHVLKVTKNVDRLRAYAKNPSSTLRAAVGENPLTPVDLLEKLALDEGDDVREGVAKNVALPPAIIDIFDDETEKYILEVIASNPALSVAKIREVANSDEGFRGAAANPNTPHDLLLRALRQGGHRDKLNLARNPSLTLAMMDALASEKTDIVVALAANRHLDPGIFDRLANSREVKVREAVADNPAAPVNVLQRLAKDKHDDVRLVAEDTLAQKA